MKTIKKLTKFTLKEYNDYNELLKEEVIDNVAILELFGLDVDDISILEFNKAQDLIYDMRIETKKIKKIYKIGGNRFKSHLNLTKLTAGQFIDFQIYINNNRLEEILSLFLIPQKMTWRGWVDNKYGDGYDVLWVQEFLLNNMRIEDVKCLTDFFLRQWQDLLKVTVMYRRKKLLKEKMKMINKQQKG